LLLGKKHAISIPGNGNIPGECCSMYMSSLVMKVIDKKKKEINLTQKTVTNIVAMMHIVNTHV
jgi:hypothetical protein